MIKFVTSVADIVEEDFYTSMLYSDMNLSRHMVYAQSIGILSLIEFLGTLSGVHQVRTTHLDSRRRLQFKMNLGVVR